MAATSKPELCNTMTALDWKHEAQNQKFLASFNITIDTSSLRRTTMGSANVAFARIALQVVTGGNRNVAFGCTAPFAARIVHHGIFLVALERFDAIRLTASRAVHVAAEWRELGR